MAKRNKPPNQNACLFKLVRSDHGYKCKKWIVLPADINDYPVDSTVCFINTCLLDRDTLYIRSLNNLNLTSGQVEIRLIGLYFSLPATCMRFAHSIVHVVPYLDIKEQRLEV